MESQQVAEKCNIFVLFDINPIMGGGVRSKSDTSVRQMSGCPHLSANCPPPKKGTLEPSLSAPVRQMSAT